MKEQEKQRRSGSTGLMVHTALLAGAGCDRAVINECVVNGHDAKLDGASCDDVLNMVQNCLTTRC